MLAVLVALSGLLPLHAESPLSTRAPVPGCISIACAGQDQFRIGWLAEKLRPYQLEVSPDMLAWSDLGSPRVGNDDYQEILVDRCAPRAYYRLRLGAVRPGFEALAMSRGDDHTYPQYAGPPAPVNLGFNISLFGKTYNTCYVNNNGNITFETPLFVYTPESLIKKQAIMIAPFWADVDTRNPESGVTRFCSEPGTVDGRPAFGVTWRDVGYFSQHIEKRNTFQLVLIDRSDRRAGDFDIEFNYNHIEWETGDASGGSNGYGGAAARVGWTNGMGMFMEYQGSGETLALLDANPYTGARNIEQGLRYQMWNSSVPGRILIPVYDGIPQSEPGLAFQMNAGANVTLNADAGRTFQLHGGIAPEDTSGVSFSWIQESGPADALIGNPLALSTTVLIPEPGQYVFCLQGSKQGAFLASSMDTVTINHPGSFEIGGGYYQRSTAQPRTFALADAFARFNGQNLTNLQWTQLEGEKASIQQANTIQPTVTLPGPGFYRFQLRAATSHSPAFVRTAEAVVLVGD